jgi:hypothetical protein
MAVINHSVKVVLGRKHVHDVSNVCHFSMWGLCLDRVAGFNFMRTCERKNETNFMRTCERKNETNFMRTCERSGTNFNACVSVLGPIFSH